MKIAGVYELLGRPSYYIILVFENALFNISELLSYVLCDSNIPIVEKRLLLFSLNQSISCLLKN